MAGRIRSSDIEELKARINLADIISDHVALKPAGVGSLKGLCPFHDERSPSFHVRPVLGYYHCFGCSESGDAITFLQRIDHVTFAEAVERLASSIGFQLTYEEGTATAETGVNRARLLHANRAAADFFRAQLDSAEASIGRTFLQERGFDAAAAEQFGVGFAPNSWDALHSHLRSAGFTREEQLAAGLLSHGDRGVYDRFRGRLLWPIRDTSGQVLGFGARKLREDDPGPKYLNTSETPVYHKSQVLYGLDLAKRDISRLGQVVVVEGYTDVMACHLAGVRTAVATCGTAFGRDHIRMIRRIMGDDSGTGAVVFTFDPDAAGQKAAMRAFSEEHRFTSQTYVAVPPEGFDPCDLRIRFGDEAVQSLIENKQPMFEFALRQAVQPFNLNTVEGRTGGLRAAVPIVASIRDQTVQRGYVRELSRMLGLEMSDVEPAVRAAVRAAARAVREPGGGGGAAGGAAGAAASAGGAGAVASAGAAGGQGSGYAEAGSAEPLTNGPRVTIASLPGDPVTRLERDAVMAMLQYPQKIEPELLKQGVRARLTHPGLESVRRAMAPQVPPVSMSTWLSGVLAAVPAPYTELAHELLVAAVPARNEEAVRKYANEIVSSLVERDLLVFKQQLVGQLQRLGVTEGEPYQRLQRQLVELETTRRALQQAREQ